MSSGPLRRITGVWAMSWTDWLVGETDFRVIYKLECGHTSLLHPYKFKSGRPYPKRRRCSKCLSPA